MARKSIGKAAKVLGGLGAAYALVNAVRPQVRERDLIDDATLEKRRNELATIVRDPRELAHRLRQEERERRGQPVIRDEEQAEIFAGFPEIVKGDTGVPIRTSDGFLTTGSALSRKKGGAVKGWGKARGARKAKVY